MTVATQTSPLRDTDDDTIEAETAQNDHPLSVEQLTFEKSVDDMKLRLEEDEDDSTPRTPSAPLPSASVGSGSRAGIDSLSPATPIGNPSFDTGRFSRKRSTIPFSLNDQYLSAPYIDDAGSIVLGNGSIEQGDVSL